MRADIVVFLVRFLFAALYSMALPRVRVGWFTMQEMEAAGFEEGRLAQLFTQFAVAEFIYS